jgi:hypothetical protein
MASLTIAATSVTVPAQVPEITPDGVPGAHALTASYTGAQLAAWPEGYGGDSCAAADGATVSTDASGNLDLHTTGGTGSCAAVQSAGFTFGNGVVEVRYDAPAAQGLLADWPAVWERGSNWPSDGEIDGFEGSSGHDYSSYWYASDTAGDPANASTCTDQCGESVNVGPASAAPGPGWHVTDIVAAAGRVSVYNDGRLYATFAGGFVTGKPMQLVLNITEGSDGLQPGTPADLLVSYVRVFS